MTNDELNAMYERKKKETLDRLLGPGSPYPVSDPIEHRYIDKNWQTGKSWRDEPRMLKKQQNHDTAFLKEYNELKRKNGGRVVTYIEPPTEDEDSSKK